MVEKMLIVHCECCCCAAEQKTEQTARRAALYNPRLAQGPQSTRRVPKVFVEFPKCSRGSGSGRQEELAQAASTSGG
jgi:hypothetical protein